MRDRKTIRKTGVTMGLAIVLLLHTTIGNNVYAETVDDLRAYIGNAVEQSDRVIIIENEDTKGVEVPEVGSQVGNVKDIEDIREDLENLEALYETRLRTGTKPSNIVAVLKNIEESKEKLEVAKQSGSTTIVHTYRYLDDRDMPNKEREDLDSKYFDIGSVGEYLQAPTNINYLVTPYGYKETPNGVEKNKHIGIDLRTNPGEPIKSVFNGYIQKIEKDTSGENFTITVSSTGGLYTIYHHIQIEPVLTKGKRVKFGQQLGIAGNTQASEPDKVNHILFQVVLDGNYINPLYLYGNNGESIYKAYKKNYSTDYRVGKTEEHFYKESMSLVNPNKGKETIYKTEDENYNILIDRPKPGIVDLDKDKLVEP